MRGVISKSGGNASLAGYKITGGQGVHREVESEGHAENCRAVVEGAIPRRTGRPKVGQGRACSMEAKAHLIHPPHQGVCGRHGGEDQYVTPGGLMWFPVAPG